MKKNEIGNNRADSKKSVESKNCDELMTVPCVDTDIKPSSDDEGDYTSEVKFVRVSDLYSNYLKRWNSYKSPKSRREYARCLERQYPGLVRHGCTNKETRLYLEESPRACEKELKSNDIDNI